MAGKNHFNLNTTSMWTPLSCELRWILIECNGDVAAGDKNNLPCAQTHIILTWATTKLVIKTEVRTTCNMSYRWICCQQQSEKTDTFCLCVTLECMNRLTVCMNRLSLYEQSDCPVCMNSLNNLSAWTMCLYVWTIWLSYMNSLSVWTVCINNLSAWTMCLYTCMNNLIDWLMIAYICLHSFCVFGPACLFTWCPL